MFDKTIKLKLKSLEDFVESQEERISALENDYNEFLEWKKMRDANQKAAATMGHFYITADDTAMLEKLIQEVNKDPDLAVLMTTANGTTLTLRTHPQPKFSGSVAQFNGLGEED